MEVLFGILIAVVGAILMYLEHKRRMQRRAALSQWATAGGWRWRPEKDRTRERFPASVFEQGHSRYSLHHLSRSIESLTPGLGEVQLEFFQYHYAVTRNSGKNSHTQHYHFQCALIAQEADLGAVQVRDEGFGDKLFQSIGFDDIDLEDPEFSRKFVVKARDRQDAYRLIGPGMMQALLRRPGWRIESLGTQLLIYRSGRLDVAACEAMVEFAQGFFAQLPRTLVNETRAARGLAPVIEGGAASTQSRAVRSAGAHEHQ